MSQNLRFPSQNDANELNRVCASLLCLDVPAGISFGIDYYHFQTGPRFMGFKMIPPGLHFVYTSSNHFDEMSPRLGFFVFLESEEVIIRRWNPDIEALVELESPEEVSRLELGVRGFSFDGNLGVYPLDSLSKWTSLSGFISQQRLADVQPVKKFVFSEALSDTAPFVSRGGLVSEESSSDLKQSLSSRMFDALGTGRIFYSDLSDSDPAGISPHELSQRHLNRVHVLLRLLSNLNKENDIIGELQIAFIAFLFGQSLVAFQHWKNLLLLLTSCSGLASSHAKLLSAFTRCLTAQLGEAPEDFFVDSITSQSFLRQALRNHFANIDESDVLSSSLIADVEVLKALVSRKFGWSYFSNELVYDASLGSFKPAFDDDEEAPVIVELGD